MALNLNQLANSVAVVEKMYSISIDGVSFGELTETDTEKLIGIIKGMQSGKQLSSTTTNTTTSKKSETVVEKSSKDDDFNAPNLGTPTSTIGFFTIYKRMVRTWETGKFRTDKVKYALKKTLIDNGAVWNKEYMAYEFPTVKACNAFITKQKAYEASRNK